MKRLLLSMCGILLTSVLTAQTFTFEGLKYWVIDDNSVKVAQQDSSAISGTVNIPSAVTYNNNTYSVTAIGNYAFIVYKLNFRYHSEQHYFYRTGSVFWLQRFDFDKHSEQRYFYRSGGVSFLQFCVGYHSEQCYFYRKSCVYQMQKLNFGYHSE